MSLFPNEMPASSGAARRRGLTNAIGFLDYLDKQRSTRRILLCLLPAFLLLMWPTAFTANEINYFMLALKHTSPGSFSTYSAIFDSSDGKFLGDLILGNLVEWLGYDIAHDILRLAMAVGYAAAAAYLLNALGLSAFDGLLVVGAFVLATQDILGKEWLFGGVETKTAAYALIMVALSLVIRSRPRAATFLAVLATYLHFLVGGFWMVALLAYDAIRDYAPRRTARLFLLYAALVGPLVAVIAYEQFGSLSGVAREPDANLIYAARAAHHIAPFLNMDQLARWLPDIVALFMWCLFFLFLSRSGFARSRPIVPWVAILLCYLVFALGVSLLDSQTLLFAKFYLFRPSSLTLFCALLVVIALLGDFERKGAIRPYLRRTAFAILIPAAAFVAASDKVSEVSHERQAIKDSIARMNAMIRKTSAPDEIVLVEPGDEYNFPLAALPMLLDRPTLVSFKFIPTNDREIYRWYDLLLYRKAVFVDHCKGIDRFPVRYLLMMRRPGLAPPCGAVVWESDTFALVDPTAKAD